MLTSSGIVYQAQVVDSLPSVPTGAFNTLSDVAPADFLVALPDSLVRKFIRLKIGVLSFIREDALPFMMAGASSWYMTSVRLIPRIRADLRAGCVRVCSKQWPRFITLALFGFVVHLPALQGEMVWDDSFLVRDNPFIKSPLLIFEAFRHYLFLDFYSTHYRPVQNLSFIVDYFFWNTNVYGFHLTNILLHIASALLLYLLLGKLFRLFPWRAIG